MLHKGDILIMITYHLNAKVGSNRNLLRHVIGTQILNDLNNDEVFVDSPTM